MTKEDYMRLPKERLAELLVEKENQRFAYMQIHPLCYEQGGTCTNPFRDCINCPKQFNNPHEVFTVSTSHLEELQPDGTYKPCGEREVTGVLKEFIEQMKTPEESLGVTSEKWNDIVRELIFDEGMDIPFGAFDSELHYFEINIPDGFEATIEDRKIILKKEE